MFNNNFSNLKRHLKTNIMMYLVYIYIEREGYKKNNSETHFVLN